MLILEEVMPQTDDRSGSTSAQGYRGSTQLFLEMHKVAQRYIM